jgi:23S rRNA (uracil1939-C5)-methyltransferase
VTADGATHVPFTLPGETVDLVGEPRVVDGSSSRIDPACPHFGTCGGCALQHADDAFLAGWKAGQIVDALAARGIETTLRPTIVSPPQSRRRVVLAGRRTRKTVMVGFHGRRDDTLVPIDTCAVVHATIVAALPLCRTITGLLASRRGEIRLALTVAETGLDLDVAGGREPDLDLCNRLAALTETADLARLSLDGEVLATRRPPWQRMGRAQVVPPPGGFLQATADGEAALVAAVTEAIGDAGAIVDLFSGCGTFSLPLAEHGAVHAVEAEGEALAALDAAARATPCLRPVGTERRDLFRRPLLPAELARFDAAVIDPPRAGAFAQAEALAASQLSRLASVSCNPATFARDARCLIDAGWRLDWVQPVDQFRWSPHVELAACFSR